MMLYDVGNGNHVNLYQVTRILVRPSGEAAGVYTAGSEKEILVQGKERVRDLILAAQGMSK